MTTITIDRAVVEQALHVAESAGYPVALIKALRAALAQPVPHGCHVDLHLGMKPDGCVLDENRPEDCVYAPLLFREGKDKTACEYWQPIEVTR